MSGSQNAGGTSQVNIPCNGSAHFMMPGSNLKFTYTFAHAGAGVANARFAFKGAVRSAYSLIRRITLSCGSTPIHTFSNYSEFMDGLIAHSSNADYIEKDMNIYAHAGRVMGGGAGFSYSGTVCLPLVGLLSSPRAIPLALMGGPLQLSIEWNSLGNAVEVGTTDPVLTGFTISNLSYNFTGLSVDQAVLQGMKQMLGSEVYVLPYLDYQCVSVPCPVAGPMTYQNSLSAKSLQSIHFTQITTAHLGVSTNITTDDVFNNDAKSGSEFSIADGITDIRFLVDGQPVNLPLDSTQPAELFLELNKVFGKTFDSARVDFSNSATFPTKSFACGVSTERISEGGMDLTGIEAQNVILSMTAGATATTLFVVYTMERLLQIDAAGTVATTL
jgi:hypothetical protein